MRFRAPRTIGSDDVAQVRDLALSGDRVWLAYALKDGPNSIESFWGTYRYSATPALDVWHSDDLFFSQFGELRIDASTAGDVVFSTSTPGAGIFTRSFNASDIPAEVPPEWYPAPGDAVDHGLGQVWDQSEQGHRIQLIRTDGTAKMLGPGGSTTTVFAGAVGDQLLLDDDGSAMVIRSGDGQRIDVHRGGLGQPFTVAQQIGAGTSTKRLEDAGEGGGVEFVVFEDHDTDELHWWVNGDGSSVPPGPALTLHALPKWTLGPSVSVGWNSSAETAQLQTRSGRPYETRRSAWERRRDPATSPTEVLVDTAATHCFRARSHGEGLSLGEFSPQRCTTMPMDDRSLAGASTWNELTASKYFNGKASMTRTKEPHVVCDGGG